MLRCVDGHTGMKPGRNSNNNTACTRNEATRSLGLLGDPGDQSRTGRQQAHVCEERSRRQEPVREGWPHPTSRVATPRHLLTSRSKLVLLRGPAFFSAVARRQRGIDMAPSWREHGDDTSSAVGAAFNKAHLTPSSSKRPSSRLSSPYTRLHPESVPPAPCVPSEPESGLHDELELPNGLAEQHRLHLLVDVIGCSRPHRPLHVSNPPLGAKGPTTSHFANT